MRSGAWAAGALLGLAAAVLAVPSQAGPGDVRVVEVSYTGASASTSNAPVGWSTVRAGRDEHAFSVSVDDALTSKVALWVRTTRPGASTATSRLVCPSDSHRFRIEPATAVRVAPASGRCADGVVSSPTSGTIAIRFVRPKAPAPVRVKPVPRVRIVPPADRWALVVGIADYAGTTHSTIAGRGDALVVRRTLLHHGWRADHIRMLVDARATADRIVAGMRWLARKSGPDTFSVFHYSGHTCIASRGPCASGHYYLWAYDNRMLSEQSVAALLRGVRGRAWIDYMGCEAAGVVRSLASPRRLVTASSRADEKSYERSKWQESVWVRFAWHRGLLDGRADRNGNGHVSILEAVNWAQRSAPEFTASQQPYGPQHPVILGGHGHGWRLGAPTVSSR